MHIGTWGSGEAKTDRRPHIFRYCKKPKRLPSNNGGQETCEHGFWRLSIFVLSFFFPFFFSSFRSLEFLLPSLFAGGMVKSHLTHTEWCLFFFGEVWVGPTPCFAVNVSALGQNIFDFDCRFGTLLTNAQLWVALNGLIYPQMFLGIGTSECWSKFDPVSTHKCRSLSFELLWFSLRLICSYHVTYISSPIKLHWHPICRAH